MQNENIFDRFNNWVQNIEFSVVNVIATIAPWLSPLAPAYLSFIHMIEYLHFPVWLAWTVAANVEMLGLATVHTMLTFWSHNRNYTTDKNRVPTLIPLGTFIFYLSIVLTINVMIEIVRFGYSPVVLAQGLLTLMTVPASVTLSIRAVFKEKKESIRQSNLQKRQHAGNSGTMAISREDWRSVSHEDRMKIAVMTPKEIAASYGIPSRTAYNWLEKAKEHAENYIYSQENK